MFAFVLRIVRSFSVVRCANKAQQTEAIANFSSNFVVSLFFAQQKRNPILIAKANFVASRNELRRNSRRKLQKKVRKKFEKTFAEKFDFEARSSRSFWRAFWISIAQSLKKKNAKKLQTKRHEKKQSNFAEAKRKFADFLRLLLLLLKLKQIKIKIKIQINKKIEIEKVLHEKKAKKLHLELRNFSSSSQLEL